MSYTISATQVDLLLAVEAGRLLRVRTAVRQARSYGWSRKDSEGHTPIRPQRIEALYQRGLIAKLAVEGESMDALSLTTRGVRVLVPYKPRVETMSDDPSAGPRFPQRTSCRYCKKMLERQSATDPWTYAMGPGLSGRSSECSNAPNPDDGPMPGHEPGTAIVSPPAPVQPAGRQSFPAPVIPYIPRDQTDRGKP